MRQINRRDGGARTPAIIADELKSYGKLAGMVTAGAYFYKYFIFELRAYEVTYLNKSGSVGEAIAVREIPETALDYLLPRAKTAAPVNPYDYKIGGF